MKLVLSGSQWISLLLTGYNAVVVNGSQWLPVVLNGYQCFLVVLNGSQ